MNLSCYAINASRRLYSCVAVTFCNCAPLCTVCTCNFATMHSFRQPQTGSGYSQQSRNCNVFVTSPAGSGGGASCCRSCPRTRGPPPGQTGWRRGRGGSQTLILNMQVKLTTHKDRDMHKNFNFLQGNLLFWLHYF